MEKLKIYVTAHIADVLAKDAENFEFYKKDGRTLNKNALLTKIVVHYSGRFSREQASLADFLARKLHAAGSEAAKALPAIFDRLNERAAATDGEKFDVPLSLKPTKESEPVIDYIEAYSLSGRTLSEYFRSLFAAYASLPQDKREEIVFKAQYDTLSEAIRRKKKVFLTTAAKAAMEISPYALSGSKEELHLYLIGMGRTCFPLRLSRIASVTLLPDDAVFPEEQVRLAEKMIRYGPQFACRAGEGKVLVELTPQGEKKFRKLYVHRPVPVKAEGCRLWFDCSHFQIVQYFERFGKDARVIYPESVRNAIVSFHRRALAAYGELPPKQDPM